MSEEQNIPPESSNEQSSVDSSQSAVSSSEQSAINQQAVTSNEQRTTGNEQPQNMEVHHHSHAHGKRNWKSYFWEFLMLFLAVFCGFLAEYQLEHKIEKDRAKELAISFYEELKNDSVNVVLKVQNRIRQEKAIAYLMKYFNDSSLVNISKTFSLNFLYGIYFRSPSLFEPRTVVLEQLQNSGSLRYFKNNELQKLIGELSVAIHNINDRQILETQVRYEYINPLVVKHYDFNFDAQLVGDGKISFTVAATEYEKNDIIIPFHFNGIEKFDKQGTINALGLYGRAALQSTRTLHYQKYIELNHQLLSVLRKEYRIK